MNALKKVGFLNLMLVFVPVAAAMRFFFEAPALWVFAISGAAIIPLAGLMGKSTEMLAHRLGPGIGGLLNASFGNAAEVIIAVFALKAGLVGVVKASITGSILGNILLVLGASFFAGGLRYRRQKFNATAAGMSATLLVLAAVALLVPAIFHAHIVVHQSQVQAQEQAQKQKPDEKKQQQAKEPEKEQSPAPVEKEQELSLEIAIVLFVVYVLLLLFSLKTHKHLYNEEAEPEDDADRPLPFAETSHETDDAKVWSQKTSVMVLVAATACVALMSEILVGAIEESSKQLGWTELFVGVFVVAIIGNAAEHSTAILAALKNRMELGFQIAVGSGLQIALFVAPLLVFISYLPGFEHRLDLVFSMLEVVAVVVSVLIVGLVAYDGESNWMEGLLLLAVYVILGIAFYHLPQPLHH